MFLNRIPPSVRRKGLVVCLITLLLMGISVSGLTVSADPEDPELPLGEPSGPLPDKPKHARLDSHLNKIVKQIGSMGALSLAESAPISVGDLVAVTVRVSHNVTGTVEFLESVGALVANIGADYIEAYVPVTVLVTLSEQDGVLKVKTIIPPAPGVTSQGTTIHRSPIWNTRGYTGDGIKVGVIDSGFNGYSALMGSELPTAVVARCYTAVGFFSSNLSSCEAGSVHGTAVAEAIVDIVPDVTLYIANPISKGDLQSTAAWMVSEGVQVINMSLAWSWDGPGDGTSTYTESPLNTVDSAAASGVTWVNSAGNYAGRNWYGAYSDADSDGYLEFVSVDETNHLELEAGQTIRIFLRWDDDWGIADSDLDLSIWDDTSPYLTKLDGSNDTQDGTSGQDPIELLTFTAPSSNKFHLVVTHESGPAPERFQLVVWGYSDELETPISSYSIANPAESSNTGMLAVGAANWATPSTIESFSSRGPTTDGRIKPEIVGADRGDSASYGVNGFAGTSQASPHVAGLAALVRERFPAYTPQQVATYLKDNASGVGTVPNSTWGYGLAQMPSFEPTAPRDVIATPSVRQATVTWSAPSDSGGSAVTLYTVTSNPRELTATTTGTSVAVTGLTNGTTYTFTVTATNSIGTSVPSDASNSVTTHTVPSAPISVSAVAEDVLAAVSWTAPASDGGSPITLYTVTSDPGDVTATTANTSITITGLTQNTEYTFTVTATNAPGISENSAPSSPVMTLLTNVWNAPSTSSWSLVALIAGMLVVMVIGLRLTSGARRASRP